MFLILTVLLVGLSFATSFGFLLQKHTVARHRAQQLIGNVRPTKSSPLYAVLECESGEFDKIVIKSEGMVVVDFYADWCGPCKIMAKSFEALSNEYDNAKVKFVKVNTDKHEETVAAYNIQGLPLVAVFVGGQMIASHCGAMTKDKLQHFIVQNTKLE